MAAAVCSALRCVRHCAHKDWLIPPSRAASVGRLILCRCDERTRHQAAPVHAGGRKLVLQLWFTMRPVKLIRRPPHVLCDGADSCREYLNTGQSTWTLATHPLSGRAATAPLSAAGLLRPALDHGGRRVPGHLNAEVAVPSRRTIG